MDNTINRTFVKTISWASIFAGVLAVLAISFLLSLLGAALGFSLLDPMSHDDISNGSGTVVTIWTLISLLVSLGIGAYLAGKFAGLDGGMHGFLVWALSLLIGLILSIMTLNSAVKTTANTVGSIASVTGTLASGIGKSSVELIKENNILDNVIPSISDLTDGTDSKIAQALEKSKVPELQPNYLSSQVDWAKKQTEEAVKQVALNPSQYKEITKNLLTTIEQRVQTINAAISKDDVKKAIMANNPSFTAAEADQAAENFMQARTQATVKVQTFFNDLTVNINNSEKKYEQLKEQVREQAATAAKAAAKTALWSFIGLFIGMLVTIFAGRFGATAYRR
ncbi:hypothetical protein AAC899_00935 [Acinetobacter soli]|uniref:hypothetical protein n=1 Tax=Acinetobacter soli TaxID=487316 RepID=UPI00125DCEB8|nr:hypothetical protein [Acinetobacter soli]MBO3638794.1 hypothetical protein [Acinetobacter soli]